MDTASKWLEAGLEYFTRNGKVDLKEVNTSGSFGITVLKSLGKAR